MHASLTPRFNLLLLFLSAAVVALCFVASAPPRIVVLLPFVFAGVAAGLLQARAVAAAHAAFRAAESWQSVRKVLVSSVVGKLSVILVWFNGVAIVALLLFGGELVSFSTAVAAYASFMFSRELASLRSVVALSSAQPAP